MPKTMLQVEQITDFLKVAAQDPFVENRLVATEFLTFLPLSPQAWCELAYIAEQLIQDLPPTEPHFTTAVRAGARIPVRSIRSLLTHLAKDDQHPGSLICATELARHGDAAGLQRLMADASEPSLQLLACLPLETLQVSRDLFTKTLAEPDPMVQFWSTLALARLGDLKPLEQLWDSLLDENFEGPPIFWGDPWTPYNALAAARPLPEQLQTWLLDSYQTEQYKERREKDEASRVPRNATLLIGGLTGHIDVYGEPMAVPIEDSKAKAMVVDPAEAEALARRMIAAPLLDNLELNLEWSELNKLGRLTPERAGEVMATVLQSMDRAARTRIGKGIPVEGSYILLGNAMVELASTFSRGIALPLGKLLDDYRHSKPSLPGKALHWVLARSGAATLVGELGPRLSAAPAAERGEFLEWAVGIARCLKAPPPSYGAGPAAEEPSAAEPIIENLHKSARPSQREELSQAIFEEEGGQEREMAPRFSKSKGEPTRKSSKKSGKKPGSAPATRTAWPHLMCAERVAVGVPFPLEVGLGQVRDAKLEGTGEMTLPAWDFSLEVELLIDSAAFVIIEGERCFSLLVSAEDPYPRRTLKLAALGGEGMQEQRRIGVTYVAEGILRGYASRAVTVGLEASAPKPDKTKPGQPKTGPSLTAGSIDLTPSIPAEEADLTISIRHGDDAAGRTLVFSACSPHLTLEGAEDGLTTDIGTSPDKFAAELIRKASAAPDPLMLYDWLLGRGRVIAGKLPAFIRQALAAVVAQAKAEQRSASVLVVSEDPHIPWELAVIEPALLPEADCPSPFLGAQVALGRWVLSPDRPSPRPPRQVIVRDQTVVSGKYEGVPGWKRLQNAEEEAKELVLAWPPAQAVDAFYPAVRKCLQGKTPADALHFALHGQFDASGLQSGLVLLAQRPGHPDVFIPQFLEPDHVRGGNLLERKPFVFLNACQVAGGQELLGDYAGMASAFLYAGAAAVVAPLWSIDDAQARVVALGFYVSAFTDQVPPAEILRRERARYCEAAVEAGTAVSGTLLAYQFFGHPRLLLQRANP